MTTMLEASVIVAINPHEGGIDELVDGFGAQAGVDGRWELIVVDNGSRGVLSAPSIGSPSRVPLRWVQSPRPGRAASNNAGARAAAARTLIFVADDFIPAPSLVRAHLDFHRGLAGPAVGIGPALFTPACRDDPFRRWLEDSGRLYGVPFRTAASQWPRDFFYLGNASMPRDVYERVGAFDESYHYDLFDDLEFGLRLRAAGVSTHLLPKALAWHDHLVTVPERGLAMERCGAAAARFDAARGSAGPWAAMLDRSMASLAARAESATPDDASLARRFEHYAALMELAFLRGYHGSGEAAVKA